MPSKLVDITGRRFGRLAVLAFSHGGHSNYWRCLCDCGNEATVTYSQLNAGKTRSCGCLHQETVRTKALKHGHRRGGSNDKTYRCWANMLSRCRNPGSTDFKNYGERGIIVCERWLTFENFLADLGEQPPRLTLERMNNDLGYSPENCRWASRLEQSQNKRRQGVQKLTREDVLAIRADTRTGRAVARAYGISPGNVCLIKQRKAWRHI